MLKYYSEKQLGQQSRYIINNFVDRLFGIHGKIFNAAMTPIHMDNSYELIVGGKLDDCVSSLVSSFETKSVIISELEACISKNIQMDCSVLTSYVVALEESFAGNPKKGTIMVIMFYCYIMFKRLDEFFYGKSCKQELLEVTDCFFRENVNRFILDKYGSWYNMLVVEKW